MDKVIIQFEFDKSDIQSSEIGKLERLHRDLRRRPHSTLKISAFADSQGTMAFNQALSDRRADAILQYFLNEGVSAARIEAKGFGETLLLNQCSNGVECEDKEHSKNRRAELKVQIEHLQK